MTGRHTRHIVLTVLAIAVLSAPVYAHSVQLSIRGRLQAHDLTPQQVEKLEAAESLLRFPGPDGQPPLLAYLVKAAESGDLPTQLALANYYFQSSRLASQSPDEAALHNAEVLRWTRMAAEQGHAESMEQLATWYQSGRVAPNDPAESFRWARLYVNALTKALDEADEEDVFISKYKLQVGWGGLVRGWEEGHYPPPEDAEGRSRFGRHYEGKDEPEAARWFRLAADQGHVLAQFQLAGKYARGEGVPQDDVLAHMWANLAGSRADEDARVTLVGGDEAGLRDTAIRLRDLLEVGMTPAQRADAQRLAREWDAAHPREP